MDIINITGVKIDGIVACLPENRLDNREACGEMYGDGIETLIKATGIESRCVADKGTTALDLCVKAAGRLMELTGTAPEEIGGVICVTFTPEYIMPADAPVAQHRLGLPKECIAFDINMACSGYGYGLQAAASLVKATGKKFLLLDGDMQSAYLSGEDKATVPVMADAGTATLLAPSGKADEWKFSFYTDGSGRECLYIPAGGSKKPAAAEDLEPVLYEDGSRRRGVDIYMDGYEVFRFVVLEAAKFIQKFIENTELAPEAVDVFVPHQANIYMIKQLTKKLKIDKAKMWKSGDVFGNPGSASVPLTIAHNAAKWFEENDAGEARALFSGFGGGLSVSVGSISLKRDAKYEIIRITD